MTSLREVKSYWNNNPVRGDWTSLKEAVEEVYHKEDWTPRVIDQLELKGKKILDLGCGQGLNLYYCLTKGGDGIGVDISETSVKIGNRLLKQVGYSTKCFVGNAESLNFKDKSFDVIISLGVLHHTPNIRMAAKEISRTIKPDGEILVMLYKKYSFQLALIKLLRFLNRNNIIFNLVKPNKKKRYRTFFHELFTCPIVNTYSTKDLKNIFKEFRITKVVCVNTGLSRITDFINIPYWLDNLFIRLDKVLEPIFGCYLVFYGIKR